VGLRGRIELILDWAKVKGYRDGENPARWRGHLDKLLPRPAKIKQRRHYAALDYADAPAFMAALRARTEISALAPEFAILTAARSGEARGAVFGEVDFSSRIWVCPAERMKRRKEHRVPLTPRTITIINERAAEARKAMTDIDDVLVFPGEVPGEPLTDMALLLAAQRIARGMQRVTTVHGLRASFRTWGAERTNFQREVIEVALSRGLVRQAACGRAFPSRPIPAVQSNLELFQGWIFLPSN
jgi:integrase